MIWPLCIRSIAEELISIKIGIIRCKYCVWRPERIDHTLSINGWLKNLQCQLISWFMKRTCFANYFY